MEDLHAALAAHLRCQRRPLTPEEFDATPRAGETIRQSGAASPDRRHDPYAVPRCRICGAAVASCRPTR